MKLSDNFCTIRRGGVLLPPLLCFKDLLYTLYDEEDISRYYAGDLISKFFTLRKRRGLSIFFPYSHR